MAFLQDNRPHRQPFLNAPPTVLWLIGVLLLAHAVRVLLPGNWPLRIIEDYAFIPARYAGGPEFAASGTFERLVPFVSHIFLHADITHVGVNSLWLLAFGPVVARRLRPLIFLLFFLFCGIAGIVLHLLVYWGSEMAVIGASGAVAGLMGGGIRLVYGGPNAYQLAPLLSQRIVLFSLVWTGVNIVGGVLRLGTTDEITLVAWVVHLGGYFTGLLTIGLFERLSLGARRWHSN